MEHYERLAISQCHWYNAVEDAWYDPLTTIPIPVDIHLAYLQYQANLDLKRINSDMEESSNKYVYNPSVSCNATSSLYYVTTTMLRNLNVFN